VARALEIVERALELHGAPVFAYHEIVDHGHVVEDRRGNGAVFLDAIDAIPPAAALLFSAHGVANAVVRATRSRRLRIIDATCPLVAKDHHQVRKYACGGRSVVMIGHADHEEVVGTMGSVDGATVCLVGSVEDVATLSIDADAPVACATRTTLAPDDAREIIAAPGKRHPGIAGPELEDIGYATQNRQTAVRQLAREVELVLVGGARNSSDTTRLREVALGSVVRVHQIRQAADIDARWLDGVQRVGITTGASSP
jgi:4-hydroxy-3-methylbut-2-enyl diphosphate reductase